MYHRSLFPRDLFAEMDRLQRAFQDSFEGGPSIRGGARGYPALNMGGTPTSVEIFVFAPGMKPEALQVQYEKGTLTIAGERPAEPAPGQAVAHIRERFEGRFRRVVSLPDDIDPQSISATYRDGLLHIRIARTAEAQPRRIPVQ